MGKRKQKISSALRATCERLAANDPELTVFMTDKPISPEGVNLLSSVLPTNTHLTCMYMEGTNLGKNGSLDRLVDAMRKNSSIKSLYLYNNKINDKGASSLARLLLEDCNLSLKVMALYGNRIGCTGTKFLMEALEEQQKSDESRVGKLERLDLRENRVGNDGARASIQMLKKNKFLKSLFLEANCFDADTTEKLVKSVKENYFLHHFGVNYANQEQQDEVSFSLSLNKSGRRLLQNDNCPVSLWSNVLAKLKSPDQIQYFLTSNPRLFLSREAAQDRGEKRPSPSIALDGVCAKRPKISQEGPLRAPTYIEKKQKIELCNLGGKAVVCYAPPNTRKTLSIGDLVVTAEDKEDTKQCPSSSYDRVLCQFRTRPGLSLAIQTIKPMSITISRPKDSSWGIWLEEQSNLCIVGACNENDDDDTDHQERLSCGDLILSVRDERNQTLITQPQDKDEDWYQRVVHLFKTRHVLQLEIKRLGN